MFRLQSKFFIFFLLFLTILLAGVVRFSKIDINPPGLYIDEASIGYNGYKILTIGNDEHGQKYPFFFQAFGEYKFPVYIYATVLSMDLFGKNEFAIRFPSALLGTLTIPLIYILTKKTIQFNVKKEKTLFVWAPLISSILLAISPWHIHFSRGGFESNMALFFFILGLDLFLISLDVKKKGMILIISLLVFGITMYTYQAYRIITPVTILFCSIWAYKERLVSTKTILGGLLILMIFCLPLFQFFLSASGGARFAQISAFSSSSNIPSLEKLSIFPTIFLRNYISFYSTQFLFISGDGIGRHQIPNFGLVPLWQIIFVITGFYYILRYASNKKNIIILLFFLSAIPGALTVPSPHALRSLLMVIPIVIFSTYGCLVLFSNKSKLVRIFIISIFMFAVYETGMYFHFYHDHYPKTNELDWGGEYKEVIQKVNKHKKLYKYIIVDTNLGNSSIYFSFYDDSLHPMYSDKIWEVPKGLDSHDILFVGSTEKVKNIKILDTIYIKNKNHDIFSQIWITK